MTITVHAWTSRSRLGKPLTRAALGLAAFALASSVLATPGPTLPRAGSAIEASGLVAAPAARRLADIAPTLRTLFGLPADRDGNAGAPLLELLRLTEPAGG